MNIENHEELTDKLIRVSYEELTQTANGGGWRKRMLDCSRADSDGIWSFGPFTRRLLATLIQLMPTYGASYRSSLVAQEILDSRTCSW